MWLVDLTRAYSGSERSVIERIEALDGYPDDGSVTLLALSNQVAVLGTTRQTVHRINRTPTDETGILRDCMQMVNECLQQAGPNGTVNLRTFRPQLMNAASALALGDSRLTVERMPTHDQISGTWPKNYIRLEEALNHLTQAIGSATVAVNQTSLRQELERISPRWAKKSEPGAQTPGLISLLVNEGIKRQLIREETVPDRPGRPNFVLGQAAAPPSEPATSAAENGATRVTDTLSTKYIEALRGAGMGPFQEVRWDVYDALEAHLGDGLSARDLLRTAVADVRGEKDVLLSRRKPFPWSRVRVFLVQLSNRAGAFLHNQEVVRHSLHDSEITVNGLVSDWRFVLDAELFKELLRAGLEVSQFSVDELAGALYNKREDAQLDRAIDLMNYVVRAGIACEDPERQGRLVLQENLG